MDLIHVPYFFKISQLYISTFLWIRLCHPLIVVPYPNLVLIASPSPYASFLVPRYKLLPISSHYLILKEEEEVVEDNIFEYEIDLLIKRHQILSTIKKK